MNNPSLIDSNDLIPLQRSPLCHRFRRIAANHAFLWSLLGASLLLMLITGTFGLAL